MLHCIGRAVLQCRAGRFTSRDLQFEGMQPLHQLDRLSWESLLSYRVRSGSFSLCSAVAAALKTLGLRCRAWSALSKLRDRGFHRRMRSPAPLNASADPLAALSSDSRALAAAKTASGSTCMAPDRTLNSDVPLTAGRSSMLLMTCLSWSGQHCNSLNHQLDYQQCL